jgi:hypothetical protein
MYGRIMSVLCVAAAAEDLSWVDSMVHPNVSYW